MPNKFTPCRLLAGTIYKACADTKYGANLMHCLFLFFTVRRVNTVVPRYIMHSERHEKNDTYIRIRGLPRPKLLGSGTNEIYLGVVKCKSQKLHPVHFDLAVYGPIRVY